MLNWTERIIRMRKEVPEVGWGDFKVIAARDPGRARHALRLAQQFGVVRAQSRRTAARDLVRGSGFPAMPASCWSTSLSEDHSQADERGKHTLVMEAYGYRWYRVGGLDYLLKRSDIDTDASGNAAHPA